MKHIGYFTHSDCMIHDMGPMHPESPMRLQAIDIQLQADGLMLDLTPFARGRLASQCYLSQQTLRGFLGLGLNAKWAGGRQIRQRCTSTMSECLPITLLVKKTRVLRSS